MNNTSITVQNLKCGGCANTITSKLSSLKNITNVQVDVIENKVSFNYVDDADTVAVKERLKNLGYPSLEDSNSLTSMAKSFVSCASGKLSK
ncbi:heavy metal-associated domain-containing protein [uncultured Gelidibacter sp.]|uniref:heavy-metal-associated domain-containing protein n=1 Tax=uncultured Gelidibacter sp. TaxID=259318 RepID=UPI002603BC42|nr:heavy metal-associated domain-containing protein [uncultured Gelidibacter sp.]